jgi:MerR family transcriptional regulator, thiopeptide resistance regulator
VDEQDRYTIGELAASTGVTVRTLHHYDRIGLLSPGERTSAGYRLYGPAEVERLYRILALRQLGLGLKEIGAALAVDHGEVGAVIAAHLADVERQLELGHSLARKLRHLLAVANHPNDLTNEQFVETMETMMAQQSTFDDRQRAELDTAATSIGEHMAPFTDGQAKLMTQMTAEMDAGTAPSDPKVQALIEIWLGSIQSFMGPTATRARLSREAMARTMTATADTLGHEEPGRRVLEFLAAALAAPAT